MSAESDAAHLPPSALPSTIALPLDPPAPMLHAARPLMLVVFAPCLLATAALAQSTTPAQYAIKESEPRTGSSIRRNVVSPGQIPLNRRYEELTPEQQALVKSQYEPMAAGDEPPFPADGLGPLYKAIQQVLGKRLESGALTMFVDVGPDGSASAVSVMSSPDAQLTNAAATILMLTRYKPGVCAGQPCAMQFPVRVQLQVKRY